MRRNYSNTAVATTLAAGISDSDTSLTVADATGYPDPPFTITVGSEVILVGAKDGTTFSSLTRGYDGTVAAAHDSGAAVEHAVVAEDMAPSTLLFGYTPPSGVDALVRLGRVSTGDYALQNGRMVFTPFPLGLHSRITKVAVEVKTAGSDDGTLRILLYGSDSNGLPSPAKLISVITANLSVTTTGMKMIVTDIDLPAGMYWFAAVARDYTTYPVMYCSSAGNTHDTEMYPWLKDVSTGWYPRYGLCTGPGAYVSDTEWSLSKILPQNPGETGLIIGVKAE